MNKKFKASRILCFAMFLIASKTAYSVQTDCFVYPSSFETKKSDYQVCKSTCKSKHNPDADTMYKIGIVGPGDPSIHWCYYYYKKITDDFYYGHAVLFNQPPTL